MSRLSFFHPDSFSELVEVNVFHLICHPDVCLMPSLQRGNLICVWMTGFDMMILLSCLHSGGVTFQSSALPTNIWYADYLKHSCQSLDSHWQNVHVNRAPWVWQLKQVFVKLFRVAALSRCTLYYSSVSHGTLKYFLVLHGTQLLSVICGTLNYCPLSRGTNYSPVSSAH